MQLPFDLEDVIGLFAFLCEEFWDSWEGWIAFSVWLVLLAGTFFFLKWWAVIRRVKAERHLRLIEQENAMKRQKTKEEKGIATADREFAVAHELENRAGAE